MSWHMKERSSKEVAVCRTTREKMPMQPAMVEVDEVDGEVTMLATRLNWTKCRGGGASVLDIVVAVAVVKEDGTELKQLDEDLAHGVHNDVVVMKMQRRRSRAPTLLRHSRSFYNR